MKGKWFQKYLKNIKYKKRKIFVNKSEIFQFIGNDLKNNDYLMIKASLATVSIT